MFKHFLLLPVAAIVLAFTPDQQKNIFEKKEFQSVKYAVAVAPGAFPKSYGYFNKAFKFNNIDPLALRFIPTDSTNLVLVQKIMDEQLAFYLDNKKIQVKGVANSKVSDVLKKYGHQAMTLTDNTGKHYICINAICEPDNFSERWLTNWVEVKNGGTCFWHFIFSLNDKKLLFAHPNGEAQ